jgi:uncharacterized caspase-like protein
LLEVLARRDASDAVRSAAISQLGKSNEPGVAMTLSSIANNPDLSSKERALARQSGREAALRQVAPLADQSSPTFVFAAASPGEAPLESTEAGSGLFTQALMEGLNGAADINRDGVITTTELGAYIQNKVVARTYDRQHPTYVTEGPADFALVGRDGLYAKTLLVGRHEDTRLGALPTPRVDVGRLSAFFFRYTRFEGLQQLVDSFATRKNVLAAIDSAARQSGPRDLLVIYFSGHTLVGSDGVWRWLVYDSRAGDDGGPTQISSAEVNALLKKSAAQGRAVFID